MYEVAMGFVESEARGSVGVQMTLLVKLLPLGIPSPPIQRQTNTFPKVRDDLGNLISRQISQRKLGVSSQSALRFPVYVTVQTHCQI